MWFKVLLILSVICFSPIICAFQRDIRDIQLLKLRDRCRNPRPIGYLAEPIIFPLIHILQQILIKPYHLPGILHKPLTFTSVLFIRLLNPFQLEYFSDHILSFLLFWHVSYGHVRAIEETELFGVLELGKMTWRADVGLGLFELFYVALSQGVGFATRWLFMGMIDWQVAVFVVIIVIAFILPLLVLVYAHMQGPGLSACIFHL